MDLKTTTQVFRKQIGPSHNCKKFRLSRKVKKTVTNDEAVVVDKSNRKQQSSKTTETVFEEICIDSQLKVQNAVKRSLECPAAWLSFLDLAEWKRKW